MSVAMFVVKDLPVWGLPVITAAMVDLVATGGALTNAGYLAAAGAVLLLSNYPASMAFVRLSSRTYRHLAAQLRTSTAEVLQGLSIDFHTRTSAAIIQSKLVRDVENVEMMLGTAIPVFFSGIGILIGAIVVTTVQVPVFVLVFAAVVPITVIIISVLGRALRPHNENFRREIESLSRAVGEFSALMPITRAHGLEDVSGRRLAERADSVRDSGRRLDRVNGRFGVTSWISYQLLGLTCLFLSVVAALTGFLPITPGQVVLLSTYFALLTSAIVQILGLAPIVSKGLESIRSLAEVHIDPDRESNSGKPAVNEVAGRYDFVGVDFAYPGSSGLAIQGLNLRIDAGSTVAFVGSSGSGKSTVLNLALGFGRPTAGHIFLDGADLQSVDLRTFRRSVAVVPQESVLFDGSIRDNVAYGLNEVEDSAILDALANANALGFVSALPEGIHTRVGERGAALSGGQRQRLAIARALIRNPKVLILDEATSALDNESEALVRQALDVLVQGRTTLIVAHRLTTVQSADTIVVLQQGCIVETGSHEGLLAARGAYWGLYAESLG